MIDSAESHTQCWRCVVVGGDVQLTALCFWVQLHRQP